MIIAAGFIVGAVLFLLPVTTAAPWDRRDLPYVACGALLAGAAVATYMAIYVAVSS